METFNVLYKNCMNINEYFERDCLLVKLGDIVLDRLIIFLSYVLLLDLSIFLMTDRMKLFLDSALEFAPRHIRNIVVSYIRIPPCKIMARKLEIGKSYLLDIRISINSKISF